MKKVLGLIFLIISIYSFGSEKEEKRSIAKLLGTSNGKIVQVVDGDKIYPLASVTKMMTILLTYEAIEKGRISMNDMVNIPNEISRIGGSRVWMAYNDKLSVRDLLKATAIYSANNAAYSLAYYVGEGSIGNFIKMMNKKAEELGMKNTHYYTPAGLPPHMTGSKMDVSTVNDIYKLSRILIKNKDYMKIASTKKGSIRNGEQTFNSRNKLLGIEGIYGIKTGHHSLAGYNISIVSKKNNIIMIEIVLGAPDEKTRDKIVLEDFREFHSKYSYRTLMTKGEKLGEVSIKGGTTSNVSFYSSKDYEELLDKNIQIKKEVIMKKNLKAPIEAGTIVGEYRVLLDGKVYLRTNIKLKNTIEELGFFERIFN